jgi:hypothetical protein
MVVLVSARAAVKGLKSSCIKYMFLKSNRKGGFVMLASDIYT